MYFTLLHHVPADCTYGKGGKDECDILVDFIEVTPMAAQDVLNLDGLVFTSMYAAYSACTDIETHGDIEDAGKHDLVGRPLLIPSHAMRERLVGFTSEVNA